MSSQKTIQPNDKVDISKTDNEQDLNKKDLTAHSSDVNSSESEVKEATVLSDEEYHEQYQIPPEYATNTDYDPQGDDEDVKQNDVSDIQERPLNVPIGNKPPRKTREERGLPPLPSEPEDGQEPEQEEEKSMTLMEHLSELRTRLVRSFIGIGLAFVLCYTFAEQLFAELCKPLMAALPEGSKLIFTALPEAFFVYLQVGLVAAVFMASPYLFYQIWGFISPGLYDEEKKYMIPMALISAIFFLGGASFCFFVVFPYAFTFFVGFASEDIAAMPSLSEYLGFALKLLIAFGLIFEMPLFTYFLSRMGVVTATLMRKFRKYAILCIFIVAAILTPPDVISQLLMAMPMMLLYELSIGVAAVFGRKKKVEEDKPDANEDVKEEDENEKGNTA